MRYADDYVPTTPCHKWLRGGDALMVDSKRCEHCLQVKRVNDFADWTTCLVCDTAKRAERKARREERAKEKKKAGR